MTNQPKFAPESQAECFGLCRLFAKLVGLDGCFLRYREEGIGYAICEALSRTLESGPSRSTEVVPRRVEPFVLRTKGFLFRD